MFHELRTYRPVTGRNGDLIRHTTENMYPLYGEYKFKPAMLKGKAVAVEVDIEVNFRIY